MCTTVYSKLLLVLQLWKELVMKVMKEVDDICHKQKQARAALPETDKNTKSSLGHLSFTFVQSSPSDLFAQQMQPSYSNISQTECDAGIR